MGWRMEWFYIVNTSKGEFIGQIALSRIGFICLYSSSSSSTGLLFPMQLDVSGPWIYISAFY